MIDLISSLLLWVIQQMMAILPDDPFLNNAALTTQGMQTGIGWLNWLVDVNGIVTLFDLWLLAVLAFYVFRLGYSLFVRIGGAGWALGKLGL